MINFTYYSNQNNNIITNNNLSNSLNKLINIFTINHLKFDTDPNKNINTFNKNQTSDTVLGHLANDLLNNNYIVKQNKKQKISFTVKNKSFNVDAFNINEKILLEIEAGRAVINHQFLKDFFEAWCIKNNTLLKINNENTSHNGIDYLCIAVRNDYKFKSNNNIVSSNDYNKVCDFFNAFYNINYKLVPFKGLLIIGY